MSTYFDMPLDIKDRPEDFDEWYESQPWPPAYVTEQGDAASWDVQLVTNPVAVDNGDTPVWVHASHHDCYSNAEELVTDPAYERVVPCTCGEVPA